MHAPVERAMERNAHSFSRFHPTAASIHIYLAVRSKGSYHNAVRAILTSHTYLLFHLRYFRFLIDEIALPAADQHVHTHAVHTSRHTYQFRWRSEAVSRQVGAQLHPLRAALIGGEEALGRADTDFENIHINEYMRCPL